MTIASEITKLNTNLTASYTACSNKGATLPASQNFDNLASTISAIPAATEPTLASLTITPSTTAQTLTPPSGTDGYNTVIASAVTASIDNNIIAGNIKSGVNILGVSGNVIELAGETKTVTPSTTAQTITPSSGKNGLTTVTVSGVTSSIDANITAGNIKKDVSILGVTGSYEGSGSSTLTTKTITANGTYAASSDNADGYSSVTVNVSGGSFTGINREVVNGVYRAPITSFTFSLPSNATDVGERAMYYAFNGCTGLTSVDLSSLTTVNGGSAMTSAFNGCTGLTSVDLSSLTTVNGGSAMTSAFNGCTGLTSVDLSSLTTVSGRYAMQYAFQDCTGLTSVDLSSLTTVNGGSAMYYAFNGCTGLTSVDLSSLTTVNGGSVMTSAFNGCTGLTSVDLSSLTTISGNSVMSSAFSGCTGLTSVLFTNLETIGTNTSSANYGHFSNCFNNCNNLTSITFPKLEKIYCTGGTTTSYGTFAGNNKVQKMYFPKLDTITYGSGASTTNQKACKNVFYGCSALTELHFAAANQSAIEASSGYSTAWGRGAGNVTIYFDL